MNSLSRIGLFVLAITIVSCDPGITIRQTEQQSQPENTVVTIRVPTSHNLIGEGQYAPEGVEATNVSNLSIKVTNLELITQGKTFSYEQVGPVTYPITIKSGASAKLPIWFDLKPSYLSTVFKNTVELRVYYEADGGIKGFTSAFLDGEK
jgi:hypothetical protein